MLREGDIGGAARKKQKVYRVGEALFLLALAALIGVWSVHTYIYRKRAKHPPVSKEELAVKAAHHKADRREFSPEERKFLLNLARKTVREVVINRRLPEVDGSGLSSKLLEPKACFVTLNKDGRLRGCIGDIFPAEPLYRAVMDNARNAAVRDLRFFPVQKEELDQIEIEISVLTVPEPLNFDSPDDLLRKLRPYEDGVVLQVGMRSATYLPQVWEQIPDKEAFMAHLTEKAGLPGSAWRGPGTVVLVYHVEAFKESEI